MKKELTWVPSWWVIYKDAIILVADSLSAKNFKDSVLVSNWFESFLDHNLFCRSFL